MTSLITDDESKHASKSKRRQYNRRFIIKNLRADEHHFVISKEMYKLQHLRQFIQFNYDPPLHPKLQRFAGGGRVCDGESDDKTLIADMLGTLSSDHDSQIFLVWMRPSDYRIVGGRGGLIYEEELQRKIHAAESAGRPLRYVTIADYQTIFSDFWHAYCHTNEQD